MKQPDLDIPTYQAAQFRPWENKRGVAFLSDIAGALREQREWHRRVWSDACDTGFWIMGRGELTRKLFTLSSHDGRSDTQSWTFVSDDGYSVVVYGT